MDKKLNQTFTGFNKDFKKSKRFTKKYYQQNK